VRTVRRALSGLAFSGLLLASPAAMASGVSPDQATAAQKTSAMTHFTAGKQAVDQKNWEKATLELRASLDVVNSPNARLVLARALRDSGSLADAWTEYGRTIGEAKRLAATEDRYAKTADAAAAERADLEPKLAFVVVSVAHAPPDATLKAGGRLVPADEASGPIVVSAGTVDVVLSDAGGKELGRQTVSATVGQKTAVALDAAPEAPKPAADAEEKHEEPPPAEPPPDTSGGASKLRPYSYVVGGVGVAGLALFAVYGLMASSTYSDLQGACPNNACPPGKQSEIDSGRTQQAVANVSLVVGAVGLAAGGTLFVLSLSNGSSKAHTTGLVVAPGYTGLQGSF
jgi:hypothetical protein